MNERRARARAEADAADAEYRQMSVDIQNSRERSVAFAGPRIESALEMTYTGADKWRGLRAFLGIEPV